MNTLPITEADLHAFVDGKLPAARRLEVDAYLAQRPEEAERLRAYTAQNDELRALFNPVLDEAVPERLSAARPRQWQWQRLVAGLAIALFSGFPWWFGGHDGAWGFPWGLLVLAAIVWVVVRRSRNQVLYFIPPLAIAYGTMQWAIEK